MKKKNFVNVNNDEIDGRQTFEDNATSFTCSDALDFNLSHV
jgi:hypothetical protein